jgi:HPt (histidine-containing phosphotransfer) domain-containing protein
MDGVETTARIRSLGADEPYYKNLPIIALTANVVSGMKEVFLQSGFDDFLSKPIDTVKLNTLLEKWIPREKQASLSGESKTGFGTVRSHPNAPEIEGLDTMRGILLSGGTTEYYYETLTAFYEDGFEVIKEIDKCLSSRNLPLYVIHVHAMKGALANIGAEKLSETANTLETAGRRADKTFIEANNDSFLLSLKRLLDNVGDALAAHGASKDKTAGAFDTEHIRSELARLKTALEAMDAGEINRAIEALLRLSAPDEQKAAFRKLSNLILVVEYDEAETLIGSLLETL